ILGDLAPLNRDFLLLDPGPPNVLEGLVSACDAFRNGIVEALGGCGSDFGDASDGHRLLPKGESPIYASRPGVSAFEVQSMDEPVREGSNDEARDRDEDEAREQGVETGEDLAPGPRAWGHL